MFDFGWVEWARKLTPEQSEAWKQQADAIRATLPPGHPGERLEASLEIAWREMVETADKTPHPAMRGGR
jgi:hypothetical protein